jgi:hypothetical protein
MWVKIGRTSVSESGSTRKSLKRRMVVGLASDGR